MSETKLNLIAGNWAAGESEVENRNPSDLGDMIGMFAQASTHQLEETLSQAQVAQALQDTSQALNGTGFEVTP